MGLATPAALMVGIGRAARNGILIKGGATVEQFSKVKTVVFDKTGTLTTGAFKIERIVPIGVSEEEIRSILYHLERHSSHPIAESIVRAFSDAAGKGSPVQWKEIAEDKGVGVNGYTVSGDLYSAGSYQMARHCTSDDSHSVYVLRNNQLIGTLDLTDEVKPGSFETIQQLKSLGIKTVMLSGDRKRVCEAVGSKLKLDAVYSEMLPHQKLDMISKFCSEGITAMVGDGINDSPALAKADIGISLSDASQAAIQSADIILLSSGDLGSLLLSLKYSKHTLLTIKQNLFWAFAYNIVAIPVAAAGLLSPAIGALSMAFSDAVLVGNSLRLRYKKIS
jgi:Cu+-exporting ATPase